MRFQKFFNELKRRNIFRVATAYAIAGWLIIQVVTSVFPAFDFPEWTTQFVIIVTVIGFPLTLIIAWAFELTPQGLKTTKEVDEDESISHSTGRKLNKVIIGSLILLIGVLVVERFFIANVVDEEGLPNDIISNVSAKSVAVLPFADLSENRDQDWFSDGLTEEVLNSLAQLPELKVTSRTSAFAFKGQDRDIKEIAQTLGVAHVVEGSVRKIGDQLRVTAQLIRAADDAHLWSEQYDSNTDNLFDVQTSIAEEIANTLDVYLDEEQRLLMFSSGTRNVEAFEEFLKGKDMYAMYHANFNMNGLYEANKHFEKAMVLDPEFGEPALFHMDFYAHVLVEGVKTDVEYSLDEARRQLIADLNYGKNNVEDRALQITTEMNVVYFSDDWNQLPVLNERLKDVLDEQGKAQLPPGNIWTSEIWGLLGEDERREEDHYLEVQENPLSVIAWNYYAMSKLKTVGLEGYLEVLDESRTHLGNLEITDVVEGYTLALYGEKERLKEIYPDGVDIEGIPHQVVPFYASMAAALGEDEKVNELLEVYSEGQVFDDSWILFPLYKTGRVEEAKALVRQLDRQPAGPANLAMDIIVLGGRMYFDPDDAPNTMARFEEAGIDVNRFEKFDWVR